MRCVVLFASSKGAEGADRAGAIVVIEKPTDFTGRFAIGSSYWDE